jgi:hypothetical protein
MLGLELIKKFVYLPGGQRDRSIHLGRWYYIYTSDEETRGGGVGWRMPDYGELLWVSME